MLTAIFNQVKEVLTAVAPAVGLSLGLPVGQSSIADEILSSSRDLSSRQASVTIPKIFWLSYRVLWTYWWQHLED